MHSHDGHDMYATESMLEMSQPLYSSFPDSEKQLTGKVMSLRALLSLQAKGMGAICCAIHWNFKW